MIRTGISSLALILSLASAPAFANPAAAPAAAAAAPTVAEADAFVARAEKELADFSTPAQQAAWINATYITDDTDAIAAKFGAEGTEMGVRFALEAAKYAGVPGLSFDTKRKIDLLRNSDRTMARARARLTASRSTAATSRRRWARCAIPPSRRRCGSAGTTLSARRCARISHAKW
jgi:peptidyl-dipeptidase A